MSKKPIDVGIRKEPVELYKVLKFEGLAPTGGEAKNFIAEGLVSVNGDIELRKRRKMLNNDLIEFDGELYRLVLDAADPETVPRSDDGASR